MAVKAKWDVGQIYQLNPALVQANHKENTRKINADDVRAMMGSIVENGQQTPVLAHVLEDGSLKLVYGYTRHSAIVNLNKHNPEQQRKLAVQVIPSTLTAAEVYTKSVIENFTRRNPDPIEVAQQQKILMEELGKSEGDVALLFGWKGSDGIERLREMQKLLNLPKSTRDLVQGRELPVTAAISMIGLEESVQKEIIKNADRLGTGRIKGESVRKAVKAKKRETAAAAGEEAVIRRSRGEIVDLFIGLTGPGEDEPVKTLFKKLEAFADGKISLETMEKHARSMAGLIKSPKAAPKPEPEAEKPAPKAKAKAPKKAAPAAAAAAAAPAAKKAPAPAVAAKKVPATAPKKAAPTTTVADPNEPEIEITSANDAGEPEPEPVG